jgi:uncharacterized protein YecE (DUF72 family)
VSLLIGTSGWQYRDWRHSFYPKGVAQARWLEHYAARFVTVELNNSFYRLPPPETFAQWRRRTPDDFVFAVKMSRYLTHVKRLADPAEPVERFFVSACELGPKLGPVLVQLPPNFQVDVDRLARCLDLFPSDVRTVVEPRHDSWWVDDLAAMLSERNVALCLADSPRRRTPVWRTADWGFIRFHEGTASPRPCYGRQALAAWAAKLASMWAPDEDVFAFFNNDPLACALDNARTFAALASDAGLRPTRVPAADDVIVGEYQRRLAGPTREPRSGPGVEAGEMSDEPATRGGSST